MTPPTTGQRADGGSATAAGRGATRPPHNDEGRARRPALSRISCDADYQLPELGQAPSPAVVQVRVTVEPPVLVIVKSLLDFEKPVIT